MIRRIAVTAFFYLWHLGVQAVAELADCVWDFPPFTELRTGRPKVRWSLALKRTVVAAISMSA